jgi:hypothetical protein
VTEEELLTKIDHWIGDLDAVREHPVYGDPLRTIRLVRDSMSRCLEEQMCDCGHSVAQHSGHGHAIGSFEPKHCSACSCDWLSSEERPRILGL